MTSYRSNNNSKPTPQTHKKHHGREKEIATEGKISCEGLVRRKSKRENSEGMTKKK